MTEEKQVPSCRRKAKARRLRISDICTDPERFQFRENGLDQYHVRELSAVVSRGADLDPMTVWRHPADERLYVLAGHHRLSAYKGARRKRPVPVVIFEGCYRDARLVALKSNSKNKLPMSAAERSNAAWCLTREWNPELGNGGHEYSREEISRASGCSPSQVAIMRRKMKELCERGDTTPDMLPPRWADACREANDKDPLTDEELDEMHEAQVAELDKQLGAAITQAGHRGPRALATVLARRLGRNYQTVMSFGETERMECDDLDDDELDSLPF